MNLGKLKNETKYKPLLSEGLRQGLNDNTGVAKILVKDLFFLPGTQEYEICRHF